jgi:hypothetical protein
MTLLRRTDENCLGDIFYRFPTVYDVPNVFVSQVIFECVNIVFRVSVNIVFAEENRRLVEFVIVVILNP